jgi:hypothetical protein
MNKRRVKPAPERVLSEKMSAQAPGTTASIIGGNLMRGSTRIGLLAVSLVCLFAFMATSAFSAERRVFDKKGGTALRDVNSTPNKNQPDAFEFVNNGTAKLATSLGTIECTELEFGTTLVNNDGVSALKLAIPFGVAEGDNCSLFGGFVPTYFDTLANGAVGNVANGNVASVTIAGAASPFTATLHDLKFSQNIGGKFCTGELDKVEGKVANSEGPFVEEKTPNLELKIEKAITVSGEGCPTTATLTANFFLETPSTTTDTAWIE